MKQRIISFLIVVTAMPLVLFGQSYSVLWKKAQEAGEKDLPQTQYDIIQKIVSKAEKEKAYGQLLKAELKGAQVMMTVSPDSLTPAVERIQQRGEAATDEALRIVYQTVLWRVCNENSNIKVVAKKPVLDENICARLANIKEKTYDPFVLSGDDSGYFDDDLLSVVGYELRDYRPLYDYYKKVGNRKAACLTAAETFRYDKEMLNELINEYQDLTEAGALAIAYYDAMSKTDSEEEVGYINNALNRWGNWKGMNKLRNALKRLTNPQLQIDYETRLNIPMRPMTIELKDMRNISTFTLKIYKVNAKGDIDLNPNYERDYKKLKPLLSSNPVKIERKYEGKEAYEFFEDSLVLEPLPVGVYMLEFTTNPSTNVVRKLYFVSDVYTLAESQPDGNTRYVVVNATTGQPIAGANLRVKQYISYNNYSTVVLKTDKNGEALYEPKAGSSSRCEVFAYTDSDEACPDMNSANRYRYYDADKQIQRTCIYTDRSIYRPGQTVHASALVYNVIDGYKHSAEEGKRVTFSLRDANWKEIKTQSAKTDKYGMCAVDFTLPSSGLTGRFTIRVGDQSYSFRVEEYKRPSFEVEFPEVKQDYKAGDTIEVKGIARTYAGVPVQGAEVEYRVVRRMAFWWWSYWRYYDGGYIGTGHDDSEVFVGEAVTDNDGTFVVKMPLTMPDSEHPLFYNFIVTADVTDTAGETHAGTLSLPLGNRKTALSVSIAEQMLLESNPVMTFHLRNAAGNDIDAEVKYRIDNGKWQKIATNVQCPLSTLHLKSGSHTVEAVCDNDTVKREFVVFSLDDKRPAVKTDDWFWISDSRFPNDGKPVTVQVGSSDKDVHIVYSIFSGNKVIERGATDKSDELINRKFTYKEEYGNGIHITFAWVKDGKCYTHNENIRRPVPDKKLDLQWTTFRDRLTPGQQEEWTLTVKKDGRPVEASFMATLYDKSLDQLQRHQWSFSPFISLPMPNTEWNYLYRNSISEFMRYNLGSLTEHSLDPSKFDESVFPAWRYYHSSLRIRGSRAMKAGAVYDVVEEAPVFAAMAKEASMDSAEENVVVGYGIQKKEVSDEAETEESSETQQVQVRENLNETAFFYPQLTTDSLGTVALKFTLPESLTTWRFMGLAHTKDMCYGMLEGEAIAQKDVMIQPNMPRFIREGDKACITARIFNLSEKAIDGKAVLRLIDPETDKVVCELSQPFTLGVKATETATFDLSQFSILNSQFSILICQVIASGDGFSDGEQHYLPILPSTERVTVTLPFTQIEPGQKDIDLTSLVPTDAKNTKLTFEYTNNPAWLMIQALPTVGKPIDENAVSQAASFYANSIGKHLIDLQPKAKTAFELWKKETGNETSLMSALEKNQELKDIVLNETPWVLDADRESEQKERLIDFFDDNTMNNRLSSSLAKLQQLQRSDGSWSWWPDMPGSFYMTVTISEMLVRLNTLTGTKAETKQMLSNAFQFMGQEVVDIVKEMKKHKWNSFPSLKTLQWLYLCSLDGRALPSDVQAANNYLMPLLKKDIRHQSIYEKAMTAVILSKTDPKRCKEYVQSLKEYTVYREEMGRYYDTQRAGYSWFDYKIPTQTMAIEAIQRITPEDTQTITEMQRWLLQSKRTQAWDTPINSVNAVYAFLWQQGEQNISPLSLDKENASVKVDNKPLATPDATAAIGYVKTVLPDAKAKALSVDKTSDGVSWGAVYAQFTQATKNIADSGSGFTLKREILKAGADSQFSTLNSQLKVGDRIKVRITITADRDYDFVQVIDRRAACLEPVVQLSGYRNGAYCTPRDYTTNYYFDMFRKGEHVIETEYYIDREGTYETGTCTVGCAYSPEFRATTSSMTIEVKK